MRYLTIIAVFFLFFAPVSAEEHEGGLLYRVTTVRAAPGSLSNLLDWYATLKASDYYQQSNRPAPLVMRHSQGDHWDLMFVAPMKSWTAFYDSVAVEKRNSAARDFADLLARKNGLIAFSEDHFAFGPDFETVARAYSENSLYHIEMFAAAPGKAV